MIKLIVTNIDAVTKADITLADLLFIETSLNNQLNELLALPNIIIADIFISKQNELLDTYTKALLPIGVLVSINHKELLNA